MVGSATAVTHSLSRYENRCSIPVAHDLPSIEQVQDRLLRKTRREAQKVDLVDGAQLHHTDGAKEDHGRRLVRAYPGLGVPAQSPGYGLPDLTRRRALGDGQADVGLVGAHLLAQKAPQAPGAAVYLQEKVHRIF